MNRYEDRTELSNVIFPLFGGTFPRVDRLCGDTCPYVCPQAQTNIALSQTMGFLNENMTWFFVYFGQLLPGLSLIVGFFKNFGIVIVFNWLFQ